MNNQIVAGSLSALAQQNNTGIAESFLNADVIILIDVSGSMDSKDARDNQRRYDVACQELAKLQTNLPGKIAVVAFSSSVQFVPGGVPPFEAGGTDLAKALRFVQVVDGLVKFIVISDGQPSDEKECLYIAGTFKSKIDVVYVGPEDDFMRGRKFLEKLAAASSGTFVVADRAYELAKDVEHLLLTA